MTVVVENTVIIVMTHDDDDGVFGIPSHKSRNRHADILLSEAESVG